MADTAQLGAHQDPELQAALQWRVNETVVYRKRRLLRSRVLGIILARGFTRNLGVRCRGKVAPSEVARPQNTAGAMPRILVIEDDLQQADIYGTLLYYNGFDITHASTVAEGIRSAGRERPDLILLDFRLPGTNGFAAISMLRNLPQIGDIPLISFSAYDVSPDSVRKAGAVDFLRKPIAGDDLVRAIRKVIGRGETPQGGAQRKRALLIAPRESPAAGTFARLLDRHGFTISRTADGATGIGVANTISPDVVLVHLDIAGVDAARVVQRLGSESQTARIPVFAISDAPPGDLAEGVISRGFAGYFQRADDVAAAEIERVTQARSSD